MTATSDMTLFSLAKSWIYGRQTVPGKPRYALPYVGGVAAYRRGSCNDVAAQDYLGFPLDGPGGSALPYGLIPGPSAADVVALPGNAADMETAPF